MKKIFRYHVGAVLFITLMCLGGIWGGYLKWVDGGIPTVLFCFGVICCVIGPFYVCLFNVCLNDEKLEGYFALGAKTIVAYKCRFDDIKRVGYHRWTYLLDRFPGNPNPIIIPIAIKNHQDILKMIVENAKQATIEPSARKKLIKDKILAA